MLVQCPECSKQVSDRAAACPGCGFPIAADLEARAAAAAAEVERQSRARVGETDCPHCDARGFSTTEGKDEKGETRSLFSWCTPCEHTGRLHLVQSTRGFFAVADAGLDTFVAGAAIDETTACFIGEAAPEHRYPNNRKRFDS